MSLREVRRVVEEEGEVKVGHVMLGCAPCKSLLRRRFKRSSCAGSGRQRQKAAVKRIRSEVPGEERHGPGEVQLSLKRKLPKFGLTMLS